jgi:hypothetical protein
MDPRTLITNISHLKDISIQPCFPKCFSEQWLMGPWSAGGHHDPVQVIFLYTLLDLLLGILGAGKEISVGHDHIWQGCRIVPHLRDVHDAPNIDASMADKDPYAGLLSEDIFLDRVVLSFFLDQGVSGRSQAAHGRPGGSAGLHDRLRDILGTLECPTNIDAIP